MKAIQVSLRHGTEENNNVVTLVAYVEDSRGSSLRVGRRITLKNHRHSDWWWHVEALNKESLPEASDIIWKISGLI